VHPLRARTLTEALRQLPTDTLSRLLQHRPDLADPPPRDLAELAGRATTTPSVSRALSRLNIWLGTVAEALAVLPDPGSVEELTDLLQEQPAVVSAAVSALRERALVWGEDDQLHLVRPVREAFEPFPGGLAPPSPRPLSASEIDSAMDHCGPEGRRVLERLLWSPTGAVRNANRATSADAARSPVEQLLGRGLLRPLDSATVIIPREVAWRLRGSRLTREPVPVAPPGLAGGTRNLTLVDRAAGGAAFSLLHDVELVVETIENAPPRLLRNGGLASRDVAALARRLDTDTAHATFLVETASAAGLLAPAPAGLLPTTAYDRWLADPAAGRWRLLADAWWSAPRLFARSAAAGTHALGPEAESSAAVDLRGSVLGGAAAAGPGTVIDATALAADLAWQLPRLVSGPADAAAVTASTWREATWLGLVALDAVSSFASLVGRPGDPWPPELLELFPAPVETIMIQADLTAVAAGPLSHAVAAELRLLADQESRGAGGVFRFSAGSLRRAYDRGWSAADVHSWLAGHSATGVPQPLVYLVDDVGRSHGSIRVGPAASVVRVDHPAEAAALLNHPRAGELGLRQVAPTVLVAAVEEPELVALLRDVGHAPIVEDAAGRALRPPDRLRATASTSAAPARDVGAANELAAALQADRSSGRAEAQLGAPTTEVTLDRLRSATRQAQPVRVGYVTADGRAVERELAPLDLAAGAVRAVDRESAEVITIPLARISAVIPVRASNGASG
jgi:Helicase conserved C-terminal domain